MVNGYDKSPIERIDSKEIFYEKIGGGIARYKALGGVLHTNKSVSKINIEDKKATSIELGSGEKYTLITLLQQQIYCIYLIN